MYRNKPENQYFPTAFSYIKIFLNTCEVTMQVKHDIGKPILHKLPIY